MPIAARFTHINARERSSMKKSMTALALVATLASGAGAAIAQDGPMRGRMGPMGAMAGPTLGGLDFVAIDTDKNGSLSRAELQARAVARLAVVDTDHDGALSRDELVVAMSDGRGGLVALFSVDPAEAMADRLIARMGGTEAGRVEVAVLASDRVNRLLAFADTDRDAAISQAEADAMQARVASRRDHHGWHRGDGHGRKAPPPPPGTPEAEGPAGGQRG
jgi:hypothetical protein